MNLVERLARRGFWRMQLTSERFLSDADLSRLAAHYGGRRQPPLSYATARDYADSVDVIGPLARFNRDMKDVQRCWTLKTILGCLKPGARLLEIGAGEPIVADALARLGYDVTVVDPYEGHGDGPRDAEAFRRIYPRLCFKPDMFSDTLAGLEPGSFDCCYSISVLEHMPPDGLDAALRGVAAFSRPGAVSIHCIDHVLAGVGAEFHRALLDRVGSFFGLAPDALDALGAAATDPEAYLLSVEAHDGWRGRRSYDAFPMRRCISVQICGIPQEGGPA